MKLEQQRLFPMPEDDKPAEPKKKDEALIIETLEHQVEYWKRRAQEAEEERERVWERAKGALKAEHLMRQLSDYLSELGQ